MKRSRTLAICALIVVLSIATAAIHLHRTAVRALDASNAAHARGEPLMAISWAEQAAKCAPIPPASEGRALLLRYAADAEKNQDRESAALAWQAYERALASTSQLDGEEATRIHDGLARAAPVTAGATAPKLPRLPELRPRAPELLTNGAALFAILAAGWFLARPSRKAAALTIAFGLVFAGLGFLV